MVQKILAIIAAFKADDWVTGVNLICDLVKGELPTFVPSTQPRVFNTGEDPLAKLQSICDDKTIKSAGDIFQEVLPIIIALLQKYLLGVA